MEMACRAAGEQIPPEGAVAILPETVPIPSQNAAPGLTLEGRNLETKVAAVREVRKHIPVKKERLEPLKVDMTKNFQLEPTSAQPPLQCLECHIIFSDRKTQERHLKKHHPAEYAQCMLGDDVLFTCYICDRHFTCSTELKAHQRAHKEKRPNKCPICGEAFRSFSGLTIHKKVHLDKQGYICVDCGKTYKTMVLLKYHRRTHTGERPYSGKACGKRFSKSKSLQKHLLTHTQEDMDGDGGGTVLLSSTEDAAHIKQLDGSPQCKPDTTFSYSLCDGIFKTANTRLQHMKLKHPHSRETVQNNVTAKMDYQNEGESVEAHTFLPAQALQHVQTRVLEQSQSLAETLCPERRLPETLALEQTHEQMETEQSQRQIEVLEPEQGKEQRKADVTQVVLHGDESCDDKARLVHLESLLAQRTAELAAEKDRVAPLLAEKETLLAEKKAEVASLKADLAAKRAENGNLRQENQRLRETSHLESQRRGLDILQEMRAGFGELQVALREQRTYWNVPAMPVSPNPRCTSTPPPESSSSEAPMSPLALSVTHNDSIQISRQHTDVRLRDVGPKDYARIHLQSFGQVGRFGCLLFRKIISEENYKAWSKTTNWDGSRGKEELPQNVKDFVVASLKQNFPGLERKDLRECIDKINEFLRTPRKSSKGYRLL